jgi:aminopeptidase-like protein
MDLIFCNYGRGNTHYTSANGITYMNNKNLFHNYHKLVIVIKMKRESNITSKFKYIVCTSF